MAESTGTEQPQAASNKTLGKARKRTSAAAKGHQHQMKWETVFSHLETARSLAAGNKAEEAVAAVGNAAEWSKKYVRSGNREETSMGLTVLEILERDVMGSLKNRDIQRFDGAISALRSVTRREAFCRAVSRTQSRVRHQYKNPSAVIRDKAVENAIASLARELKLRR